MTDPRPPGGAVDAAIGPAPRAILFDLDGTLIDSRGDIAAACNHALVAAGRAPLPIDEVRSFVGDGAALLLARALRLSPGAPEVNAALAVFDRYYQAHPVTHTRFLPGAEAALDALRDVPLAVVTNKSIATTRIILDALGVTGRFRAVVGGGPGPLKPHPAPVLRALGELGVAPCDAWMVGDGPQDVGAGRAAGCVTVGVRGGFLDESRLEASAPDVLLASLADLPPLVRRARR